MASYRELKVWQKSMELVLEIYRICKFLPKEEIYGLSDQMRRAAVSIASNIAEGQARDSKKDFIRFLNIAQGSKAEVETQLEICKMLNYLPVNEIEKAEELSSETGKMLRNLIRRLQQELYGSSNNYQLPTNN